MGFRFRQQLPSKRHLECLKLAKKYTWLNPFIINNINDLLLSNVFSILEPVRFHYTTAMRGVTAVTALLFFREDNVSFIVDNQMLTFGSDIGKDAVTSAIVSAGDLIGSLSVVCGVIEHLTVKSVGMVGDGEGLVVSDSKGRAPDWGWWGGELGGCADDQCDEPDDQVSLVH